MRKQTLPVEIPAEDRRLVDLHVHTTASDGGLSPAACVEEAARLGLAAIAITDHDTLAGNAEAMARGAELGVEVVPGVELSAAHETLTIHLLGYFPDPGAPELRAVLAELREQREERNPRILARLAELGCPLDSDEVTAEAGGGLVGRPHIAAVMIRKGYVGSLNEAFDRYLAKGAAAYVEGGKPQPAEAIEALLRARAVPVLAHPGATGARLWAQAEALVVQLVDAGLRGIEVHYPGRDSGQASAFLRLANRFNLLVTGGTDFHGPRKPGILMGRGGGSLRVPYALLARLKEERERL